VGLGSFGLQEFWQEQLGQKGLRNRIKREEDSSKLGILEGIFGQRKGVFYIGWLQRGCRILGIFGLLEEKAWLGN